MQCEIDWSTVYKKLHLKTICRLQKILQEVLWLSYPSTFVHKIFDQPVNIPLALYVTLALDFSGLLKKLDIIQCCKLPQMHNSEISFSFSFIYSSINLKYNSTNITIQQLINKITYNTRKLHYYKYAKTYHNYKCYYKKIQQY